MTAENTQSAGNTPLESGIALLAGLLALIALYAGCHAALAGSAMYSLSVTCSCQSASTPFSSRS